MNISTGYAPAITGIRKGSGYWLAAMLAFMAALAALAGPSRASVTAFQQAVAEAAADDRAVAEFYRERGYAPIWTGRSNADAKRRRAFLAAAARAGDHGLPQGRYDPAALRQAMRDLRGDRERGFLEVELSQIFLRYARDVQTGVLTPSQIDRGIARVVPLRGRKQLLEAFSKSSARGFLRALPPQTPEYLRLMKEKKRFEALVARGGWGGQVPARSLKPGRGGAAVVALRDRLVAMGYMRRSASPDYDVALQKAVQAFQADHGLAPDGVAGRATMAAINIPARVRLQQVIVAMERERWMNQPLGKRHIMVNITDYTARIIDDGKVTFATRAVVGKNADDRQTPEFSDMMEHMVINPTWNVPRSIATREYLPLFKKNPNAAGQLRLINTRGQIVQRSEIDFSQYTEKNFPFDVKEPPSRRNALGLVKFMFPNKYNIYLHDTPAKSLFGKQKRDFSHGCVRLQDPFDFAYALLAPQERDPVGFFKAKLNTGKETVVPLAQEVPVHLIYRTAFTQARGRVQFRHDVYGRDAKIWTGLANAGVALGAVKG